MIPLTAEQAQQIEEALEDIVRVFEFETGTPVEALATIRAARAQEPAEQEPVAWEHFGIPSVNGKQAEKEPLMDYERINALREGEQNGAEDAYFFVRPENDTPTLRKMFCQGFERGFHKGLKYAAPVQQAEQEPFCYLRQTTSADNPPHGWAVHFGSGEVPLYAAPVRTKDLTDDEIVEVMETWGTAFMNLDPDTAPDPDVYIARAVIAKFKEKNK